MKHGAALAVAFSGFFLLSPGTEARQASGHDVGASPGHLPKAHYVPGKAPDMTFPMWVDASLVFNRDGTVNTALVHPQGVKEIQALENIPRVNGCTPVGIDFQDIVGLPPRGTAEQAAQTSQLVILGKVTEKSYGLFVDEPGQLLRVVPEEVIKGRPRDVDAYFVFLPLGTFRMGGLKICKTDSRYPDPPAVGDQVLLFVPFQEQDQTEPLLEIQDGEGIITIHASGVVSLPKKFVQSETASSLVGKEALLERVRASAASEGH
jgi:hypothetical protein